MRFDDSGNPDLWMKLNSFCVAVFKVMVFTVVILAIPAALVVAVYILVLVASAAWHAGV